MAVSFHAKGSAPSRDHHACCDITFLHAKENHYQSIKSNQIRNYSHQEVMIFLHAKQPNMIIYHVAVVVDPCGGGRATGWWEVAVHWPQLARGQSRPRPRRPGASKRPISRGRLCPGRALCWSLLIPPAFCRNGHTWCCRWRVRDLEAFTCPCRTPRSSTLPTGWWRSLKSVIVSVQTSVKIQSTLIIFFSYFCMVLNLPLYHGEPLSRMMLGTMMRKKMMGFIHRWYFLSNLCMTRLSHVILYLRIVS